jgi:hypothetical protein
MITHEQQTSNPLVRRQRHIIRNPKGKETAGLERGWLKKHISKQESMRMIAALPGRRAIHFATLRIVKLEYDN